MQTVNKHTRHFITEKCWRRERDGFVDGVWALWWLLGGGQMVGGQGAATALSATHIHLTLNDFCYVPRELFSL